MASIILQTIFLAYLFFILICTSSLLSHDEECLALFEFKQSFFYENNDAGGFQKLDTWRKIKTNTSDNNIRDCCLWKGVVCNNKGHVIGLDLSQSSLTGVINSSSSLFKLVHLQMLNLSKNNFVESQIPSEIARLNQLTSLDLSSSGFIGQIPNEISHLMQLSSLDLSRNPLKLQSSHGLEYLLQNMTRLEVLRLSGVDLSSPVPRFLANFSSLMSIQLVDCQLQDEFPSAIFYLPKLKNLAIGFNPNLTGFLPEFHNNTLIEDLSLSSTGFSGIIPESISNLNHLDSLDLRGCNFSGRIPGSLSNLTKLTYLSLMENEFTGQIPSLASLSKLIQLLLGYNSFEIGGDYEWISKLTTLIELSIEHINIKDEILPYLANLTDLRYVSIEGNFIFGRIPTSFMNLTQLILLDLEDNQLHGQITNSFLNFKSLEYLLVGSNDFSGTIGLESFLGLNNLKVLGLNGNRLTFVITNNYTNNTLPELKVLGLSSCKLKEFPGFLQFQSKLSVLALYNNEIEGLVPSWIWNNSQETLQMFDLQNNFITGFHEHPRFLRWVRLELFGMSYNRLQGRLPIPPDTIAIYDVKNNNLTGDIPPMICELKSIQLLDLSSNKMSGILPPCLGTLNSSLTFLDLKGNNFHGQMMKACKYGSTLLKHIDLSENRFTGPVSKSLANCTNLEFLSLVDNSFEGVFPVWLGTLPKLQVLLLRSNKFYGTIQGLSTIKQEFMMLRIIDISINNFSGQLPEKLFQTWNGMKYAFVGDSLAMGSRVPFDYDLQGVTVSPFEFSYSMTLTNKGVKREYVKILKIFTAIDLSCNNFEGQIPQSLQDLHGLESLNLSNNHLTGPILPSFGNLVNLESLDLSQNKLSGEIPQQLLQLGFLAILNVSFNDLDGRIPQGKQFNTFENSSYLDNFGLCGKPLSNECENSKVSTTSVGESSNEYESLMPSDIIDWMVILLGVGSGLVIGVVIGSFLYARYGDRLLERFGMKKDIWVRPLRNIRRH